MAQGPPPQMRPASRDERIRDWMRAFYAGAAEQPLVRLSDLAGITDIQGVADEFGGPDTGLKMGEMPGSPGGKLFPERSYWMGHRPTREGPPIHDLLEGGIAPRDIYANPQHYVGDIADAKTVGPQLRALRGKPDADVTVYRGAPVGELNPGDWVTLNKKYAKQHGMADDAADDIPAFSFRAKAKDLRWAGDDLNEFGYFGNQTIQYIKKYGVAGAVSAGLINRAQADQLRAEGIQ